MRRLWQAVLGLLCRRCVAHLMLLLCCCLCGFAVCKELRFVADFIEACMQCIGCRPAQLGSGTAWWKVSSHGVLTEGVHQAAMHV